MGAVLFCKWGWPVLGYVGPGAGFAFLGSVAVLLAALLLAVLSVLFFPLRIAIGLLLRPRPRGRRMARRIVVLGLDGLDPGRLRALRARGRAPNFERLAQSGSVLDLQTTCPAISPVAWSSFMTGVNPGKHNIFDFLNRDLRTCAPQLSSCRIRTGPGGRAEISLLRKSRPFWAILGQYGVFSTVLRVPITFPPERFRGLCLSGMCVPDLRGTQGAFTVFESKPGQEPEGSSEGTRIPVRAHNGPIETRLPGPTLGGRTLTAPVRIELERDGQSANVRIGRRRLKLKRGVYSEWVRVAFRKGLRSVSGICRLLLVTARPEFKLYVSPINVDPEQPALPISHPRYYASYLAKLHGPFATLGLAEDTWALSEGILDDTAFLRQLYDIHGEREEMFFDALARTRTGFCCCVFDLLDRVQHMFERHIDEAHPARAEQTDPACGAAIDEAYRTADALVGRTLERLGERDLLLVLSDHGFCGFRRNVNLNRWLEDEGYLARKDGANGSDCLADVDWTKTRVYGFGLAGLYLNLAGREAQGIVPSEQAEALKRDLSKKLVELRDPATGEPAIRTVYDAAAVYDGPYAGNGPDLVIGYAEGYRAAWETARGCVAGEPFSDNIKAWSGDHCVDPALVPGLLASNRVLSTNGRPPHIMDIAPTVLAGFGIEKPEYMDGQALGIGEKSEVATSATASPSGHLPRNGDVGSRKSEVETC